ncbi:MAG: hypothetical protein ABW061_20675 [Polyangiaceae bacterium]
MPHRTNHGNDRKLRGERKVWENVPDGVRSAPAGAAAPVERREDGTVTPAGAAELARMRHEAAKLPDFGDRTQPWMPPAAELEPFDGARRDLLTQRRREIHALTGAVDSGVGAQLRAWAYIHAAGEYWASKFFGTGDPDAFQRMVNAFKAASTEDAKLRDAAAWAAAARPSDPMAELNRRLGITDEAKP